MTVRARLEKLESARPKAGFTVPREVAVRMFAEFYRPYFPQMGEKAWRDSFGKRVESGRLTARDQELILSIPLQFRQEDKLQRNLLNAVAGWDMEQHAARDD